MCQGDALLFCCTSGWMAVCAGNRPHQAHTSEPNAGPCTSWVAFVVSAAQGGVECDGCLSDTSAHVNSYMAFHRPLFLASLSLSCRRVWNATAAGPRPSFSSQTPSPGDLRPCRWTSPSLALSMCTACPRGQPASRSSPHLVRLGEFFKLVEVCSTLSCPSFLKTDCALTDGLATSHQDVTNLV